MTTPLAPPPDYAYVVGPGNQFAQNENETSIRGYLKHPSINPWEIAQQQFGAMFQEQVRTQAELKDGQISLRDRLELLGQNDGYVAAAMGYNWVVPFGRWSILPFENQIGPAKNASVVTPKEHSGWLCLKAGGLWRVDALGCSGGYSQWSYYSGSGFLQSGMEGILPIYMIEIVDAQGNLLTAKRSDSATEYMVASGGGFLDPGAIFSGSSSFSHTFVLDNMPPVDDPSAPEKWVYARLSFRYERMHGPYGAFYTSGSWCQVQGGTRRSHLTATRWSKDTTNKVDMPTVPDGGVLQ